ncbi:MAG: AAA family ATPase [Acidobacteriota bacterium]
MDASLPTAVDIAKILNQRVFGQDAAVRRLSIALSKKQAGISPGNALMIGASGSGKTTLMKAVEEYLSTSDRPAVSVRVHANVLGRDAERGRPGEALMHALLAAARRLVGSGAAVPELLEAARHGVVFIDEVDKIRARVGDRPNVAGIRAQESLLLLMESQDLELELPAWLGAEQIRIDTRDLLFVAGGAFEGLYDAVYDRVTVGEDRGALQPVTVVDGSEVREEYPFSLQDWLRTEDLFDYGMSPQFLARFDSVVLLEALGERELVRILLESEDSRLQQARRYLAVHGVELVLSPAAVQKIAAEASVRKRMGARALHEIVSRVLADIEFDPGARAQDGSLLLDVDDVESALD